MKVTTVKGRQIDIDALRKEQGNRIAVGNARMNGHGEILGRGGEVVKTQDQLTKEYYDANPKAAKAAPVALRDISDEVVVTPKQAIQALEAQRDEEKVKASRRKTRDAED